MFEFLGVVFLGILLWMWFTSDEVNIKIKVDGKDIFTYEKKEPEDKKEKNNKKDLK